MIEIKRESCPKILYNSPTEGKLYNKPAVVKKLWDMQHGKCCYCESEIPKDGHGKEVEHYYPQAPSLYPHFRNDWNNLLLVCHSCNGKKSHKFPLDENGNPLLIDPSTPGSDPEQYLDFEVDQDHPRFGEIKEKRNSERGEITINTIGLNRNELRIERKRYFKELFEAYVQMIIEEDQASVKKFVSLLGADRRFAGFSRAFAKSHNSILRKFNVDTPIRYEIPQI